MVKQKTEQKERLMFSCRNCGKVTTTTNTSIQSQALCFACRNGKTITAIEQKPQATALNKIEVSNDMKKYIPTHDGYIPRKIGKITDVEILQKEYANKRNVLIIGDTGTGKSALIRYLAFKLKVPFIRLNLNGSTTPEQLIGHYIPTENGHFKWIDGLLTIFVRNGGIIALDEINSCPAEILFCLHGLLDDERSLDLRDKDGEIIKAHKDLFIVATMNNDYEGTRPLNHALKSRFKTKLLFDYDNRIEDKLIKNKEILKLAEKLRLMRKKGEINSPIGVRELQAYDEHKELYGEALAFELFLNGFDIVESEAIKNVAEMLKKKPKKEETKKEDIRSSTTTTNP